MGNVIATNKKVSYNFYIVKEYEAGIVLKGWEVKSIRAGHVSLNNAFCSFWKNELFVKNMHIANYMNIPGDTTRDRKLLLQKSQLARIKSIIEEKGLTIVPKKILWKGNFIKLDIAVVKGKKKQDKRETIKKRDFERKVKKYY